MSSRTDLCVNGRTWVFGDSLNTDAMYPPDAMKLDLPEAAKMVFYKVRPGWADLVTAGDIVVAGRNFGLGSSRPVAALFRQLGVAALVAEEFNSLFFRNAVNAGLPGKDRTRATLELKTETMRPAAAGERLAVRGAVMRQAKQIAFAEARIEDAEGRLVRRSTGTFLLQRDS